jgi:hypothetical protein
MNTARSAGESASSSTRNAIDSESASSAGPAPAGTTTGSGSQSPACLSRRTRAELRWLIPRRVTAVARYALGSWTAVPARRARARPANASWTMSSASPADPVIP